MSPSLRRETILAPSLCPGSGQPPLEGITGALGNRDTRHRVRGTCPECGKTVAYTRFGLYDHSPRERQQSVMLGGRALLAVHALLTSHPDPDPALMALVPPGLRRPKRSP